MAPIIKKSLLKLAFIRQRYVPDGGAERILQRTIAGMRDREVALTVIARDWEAVQGVHIARWQGRWLTRTGRDRGFARFACDQVSRGGFDLVQSHERIACCDIYRAGDGVHAEWLQQRNRARSVWSSLSATMSSYHRYLLAAEKTLFSSERLQAVICNSEMVRQEIKTRFGVPKEKLHLIYNGVDLQRYSPALRENRQKILTQLGILSGAFVFLFVGSGFERKGLEMALRAFAGAAPEAHFVIVGRDRNEAAFKRLAERLDIGSRVHFLGISEDVSTYYGMADALLLPTLYDPFPNVCTEAFASGIPVITSTKCGAAELIQEGVNGHVCDALDLVSLKNALRVCKGNGHAHYTESARATVEEFSLDNMVGNLIDLYDRVLQEKA